ncbi:MAG: hypothetical protein ACKO37_07925, partial [Vampirovibrionales bacterium]
MHPSYTLIRPSTQATGKTAYSRNKRSVPPQGYHKHTRARNHLPSKKVPWKLLFAIAALPLFDITLLHGKGLATLSRGKLPFLKAMSEDIDHILTQDGYAT